MEEATDPGFAKAGIEQQRAVGELRERNREIRGSGRLAFPRERASDQNDLRWMIGLREKNGSAQGAKRFRHLRLGQVLSNELDAFVMPIGREALQNTMASAAAVGICKLRHDSERSQPRKSVAVVRSLHGIVDILAHQSHAYAAIQAHDKVQRNGTGLTFTPPHGTNITEQSCHDHRVDY